MNQFDKFFFVYHNTKDESLRIPSISDYPNCLIIGPQRIAELILDYGLVDWINNKS
jgi:hypothetical protein